MGTEIDWEENQRLQKRSLELSVRESEMRIDRLVESFELEKKRVELEERRVVAYEIDVDRLAKSCEAEIEFKRKSNEIWDRIAKALEAMSNKGKLTGGM
jgi:hypothetical protein